MQIYLLIGQSNMAGRAPYTAEESGAIPHCFLLNSRDEWEAARNPLNQYSTIRKDLSMQEMNPGYAFVQVMLAADSTAQIGLVVNARGGSSIAEWDVGTQYYEEALRRTRIAQRSGTLRGVLWHQGEADYEDGNYLTKLTRLIINLRRDLNEPDLPFVAGQINNVKLINDQIAALPTVMKNTGFASSQDLRVMAPDPWHFDAASTKLLGRRYAKAMLAIQAQQNSHTP